MYFPIPRFAALVSTPPLVVVFRRGTGNDATGLGRIIIIIPSLDSRKSMGYFSWGNHRWGYSVMEIFHGILSGLFHGFQLCNVSE